jgi:hypothetical protein
MTKPGQDKNPGQDKPWKRQTLEGHTLDRTNTGHHKSRTGETLDRTNLGEKKHNLPNLTKLT